MNYQELNPPKLVPLQYQWIRFVFSADYSSKVTTRQQQVDNLSMQWCNDILKRNQALIHRAAETQDSQCISRTCCWRTRRGGRGWRRRWGPPRRRTGRRARTPSWGARCGACRRWPAGSCCSRSSWSQSFPAPCWRSQLKAAASKFFLMRAKRIQGTDELEQLDRSSHSSTLANNFMGCKGKKENTDWFKN